MTHVNRSCTFPALRRNHMRAGFTMVEAVVATLIVSGLLVAALNSVGAARSGDIKNAERRVALVLARDLMAEILEQHYADPDYGLGSFGLASAEIGDGSRALWEDVDDYDGWSASPPQEKDGTPMDWASRYGRAVTVQWVEPTDLATIQSSETGAKLITVTVTHDDLELVTLTAVRTDVWSDPVETAGADR